MATIELPIGDIPWLDRLCGKLRLLWQVNRHHSLGRCAQTRPAVLIKRAVHPSSLAAPRARNGAREGQPIAPLLRGAHVPYPGWPVGWAAEAQRHPMALDGHLFLDHPDAANCVPVSNVKPELVRAPSMPRVTELPPIIPRKGLSQSLGTVSRHANTTCCPEANLVPNLSVVLHFPKDISLRKAAS